MKFVGGGGEANRDREQIETERQRKAFQIPGRHLARSKPGDAGHPYLLGLEGAC
jgi:hypothetical protein